MKTRSHAPEEQGRTRTAARPLTLAPSSTSRGRMLPPAHPLHLWDEQEAAQNCRISESLLRQSTCPRIKFGARVLYDPIETMLFVRTMLTHCLSEPLAEVER